MGDRSFATGVYNFRAGCYNRVNRAMPKDFNFYLQRVISDIKEKYKPEKIILFGSAVSGKRKKWSDADLVVIKRTKKKFCDRIEEIFSLVEHEISLDLLVYTPDEFQEMAKWNYFIQKEVLKKGRVLYESQEAIH